jgi:hypothetical protein
MQGGYLVDVPLVRRHLRRRVRSTLLGMGPLGPIGRKRSVSPSLHAAIEDLLLVVTTSKGGLTLALVQVTIIVALTLGVAQSWGLLAGAARQKHRLND